VDTARTWRGGQNQVLLTARGMAARGHEVTVACQSGGALEARLRDTPVEVRPMRFQGDLGPGAALGLARAVRELQPDVIQLHDPHAAGAGLLAAGFAGAHQDARPRLVATRRVDFALRGAMSVWKYRACSRVIAVSRAIAHVLEEGGLNAGRIRVVYEGVPDRAPRPGGREALAALGIAPDCAVVGNVAALTGHKDHAVLLDAAARVLQRREDVRFVIVGDGELRPSLEERARSLGLAERCVFAGFRDDVDRLLPAFTVFCLSSKQEGLGTSVLDAMAFGRPVVATAAGGIPEAVEDGVTGRVVPPGDPDALADALLAVLDDKAARERMGADGRRRFEERFTADIMVERTLDILSEAP
jgi:glycosyltransferase involved in cell wall biosynthesis